MLRSSTVVAATLLGAAVLAQPASAQDFTTATFGGTTIWVGGGVQFLSLPDIKMTGKGGLANFRRQENSDSDWLDFGGATGAGMETALGWWGGYRVSGSIEGFWASVETDNTTRCSGAGFYCVVVDPADGSMGSLSNALRTRTDREADYWGGQVELKFATGQPAHIRPQVYRNDYFIAGFDVRGIDQNNRLRGRDGPIAVFDYKETLDTTYYGGYIGMGGEYSFGFIPIIGNALKGGGGIYERLGLRTFIEVKAGLYDSQTDYRGHITYPFAGVGSRISQSNDELAFIGTISLETRKQLGTRTSLSLWTDYEYISSVPGIKYAGPGGTTRIDDDAVFASRTMLRLNIGLGSQQLYAGEGY